MKPRTQEQFQAEIEAARRKLQASGRDFSDDAQDLKGLFSQGISGDFELPYSSLPKIWGKKWKCADYIKM